VDTELLPVAEVETEAHRFTTIVCCYCGHEHKIPVYCGNRFCPICSRPRLARVRRRIGFLVKNNQFRMGYDFKHLTLTIRNRRDLCGMLRHLSKSFRRLRQRRLWRNHVEGGAFVFEVTSKDGYYHVHIHCIIYARFIEWQSLLKLWIDTSGGRGVYIQRIPQSQIVLYLTKYMSKPSCSPDIMQDVQEGLTGLRLFSPFGTWYALNKTYIDVKPGCPVCGKHYFLPFDLLYTNLRKSHSFIDTG